MNVAEWLGDSKIGIDIWENKYRHDNETLDEWFDRVSGGDEDIKQLIKDKKFLFGGRALSNRSLNNGSMANCFIEGTKVITKDGLKSIDSICVGDEVITEDGSFQKVNDVFARDYEGDLFRIKSRDIYKDITCTPNHQFLTQNGWVRADRLLAANVRVSRADRFKVAEFEFPKKYDMVDITEHFIDDDRTRILECDDGKIRTATSFMNRGTMCSSKQGNPLNRYIEMTEDFRYFIGRWIGDGSITKYKKMRYPSVLQIVFNQKTEEKEALEIAKIGEQLFGIAPSIRYTEQNVIAVRFENQILGSWFIGEFGSKCDGKFISKKYDGDLKIALGMIDSDGSFGTHGAFKIVLKNLGLVRWLRNTLYLNGINTSEISRVIKYEGHYMFTIGCGMVNGKLKNLTKKTYHDKRMGIDQQKFLVRDYVVITDITILEDQKCKVYNLSVENNHTYTVNGIICHNCYSSGYISDDYKSILKANTKLGLTYKAQGGQGVSLSKIRPKGVPIGDRYESDGIIPFLELFNKTTEVTSQAGSRKGALLASLDIRHKQAEEFIKIKTEENTINKANLSMEIDDGFMECVDNFYENGDKNVIHESREYSGHKVEYDISPIDTFKLLSQTSYDWAEPGVLFTEEFRNYNLMEYHNEYIVETANPCSEQPLKKDGNCTLGSLDLSKFVNNEYSVDASFDFQEFQKAIIISIRALDDILDENLPNHPVKAQRKASKNFRNIGLGVFGLATMFFKMGITYGSEDSKEIVDIIFNSMFREAVFASNNLAKEKGTFPKYKDCVFDSRIIKAHFNESEIEELRKDGIRNCSLLSIAPAGSIATCLGSSTSAEPEFAIKYNRKTHNLDDSYDIYCAEAQYYLKLTNSKVLPDYFVCSKDIHWKDRVDVQAVIQKHIDTGISSTVNLPNNTTVEEVEQLYLYAWKQKIKGITIFRDGCKREGILTTGDSTQPVVQNQFDYITPPTKEDIGETIGFNDKKKVACGSLYLSIFRDPESNNIVETYIDKSKSGVCAAMSQGMSRLVSTCLRSGVSVEYLCDQLIGIKCPACTSARKDGRDVGKSCPDSIGQYILEKYKQGITFTDIKTIEQPIALNTAIPLILSSVECPECGEKLAFVGGCQTCVCGYSKCG